MSRREQLSVGQLSMNHGTVTGAAGAATLHKTSGVVTTESLTTAAGVEYTLTLTNREIAADDVVLVSVSTAGTGTPTVTTVAEAAGSVVIKVRNSHATVAFSAALKVKFAVIKAK